ncbi:unnamed protein product [Anisakis simplex]|uniref:Laminin-like protein epi-1 (inferred by orthology to a C. elegans protein) n=1 Tax=Anisakis simplex TaxID=6269 RepID=A0A0M3JU32_ANISI|nr:unnamed protein product [Anisakis simplex]
MVLLVLLLLLAAFTSGTYAEVLVPPYTNLALGRHIEASSTCGELNGQPIKEMFCQIAGSNQYTPLNQYSYTAENDLSVFAELRMEKQSFVQGGQNCDFCEANSSYAHPASNMVDGMATWWQSPPLSRGMQYNQVNITIDLGQEFHVAYVWIQMANSPRPGSWVLERSVDNGETFIPWQYFAETPAECDRIMINLLENRPGKLNFSHSLVLQNFSRATNVRLRLLRTKTFHGHLMDVTRRNDPTVTRRYFYSIKEIFMGGRCVCHGHADTCDILDVRRSTNTSLCEHNTCGDQCEKCCPGFEQKKWQRAKEGEKFVCEPCNCHGHSEQCEYDEEIDRNHLSLDIHGEYEGGGRCLHCRDNTEGINCNKCSAGYYRPRGKFWNETDVCQRMFFVDHFFSCHCDPTKHTGICAEETAKCECKAQFVGENCDQCAMGYYSPPECKPCECAINGTVGGTCLPIDDQCPCKPNYDGVFCQSCAAGFTNLTAGCAKCECDETGSLNNNCSESTGQCICKPNFGGVSCDVCADGYFDYPKCEYCDCDASGTEEGICNKTNGVCLCKPGFAGDRCDQCDSAFYGYPNCKPCECNTIGSKLSECDLKSGDCPCYANFTGRQCDRCAAGYYDYPNCKPCSCLASGSKGMTCDSSGQCYCKANFQGERCDQCKTNFYNFPICEECNCNPSGVVASFAGCDKVAPGELCTCRANVIGRTCDQCKPTFWDLQYQHAEGCISCGCHLAGTISMLNDCDPINGQCFCKRHVSGRRCERCGDGFYQLQSYDQLGCQPCECDIGGALGVGCDINTGQCRCRPRITGRECNKPIVNHYFPTLWHNQYEAEDGMTADNRSVRFAIDENQFPNFSWRGFAVFSPIQDEIIIDVIVHRASLYRLLFHHANPTQVNVDAEVFLTPTYTHTQDVEQSVKISFVPTDAPSTVVVNTKQPFVLNPGRWRIRTKTKQRLFLDFIVLLPSEYYEGSLLKERITEPCEANNTQNSTCIDLLYPPLPVASRFDVNDDRTVNEIAEDGSETILEKVPVEVSPAAIGSAVFVRADNRSRQVQMKLDVPEKGDYVVVTEYHNLEKTEQPVEIKINQNNSTILNGIVSIHYCPYATFCREVISSNGSVAVVQLEAETPAILTFTVEPTQEFGLAAVNLIKSKDWNIDYLHQVPVCIRKKGKCVEQWYPPAPNSIVTEAESGTNSKGAISAEKLPFVISNPKGVQVMVLDENQATVDIAGMVPAPGHYVFIVNYFNPDNTPVDAEILLQNEQFHQAYVPFSYCPSIYGCRALIRDKNRHEIIHFWMDDKYTASFYYNSTQKGPLYIDSITTVPYQSFSDSLMNPQPIDLSTEYVTECQIGNFKNDPANVSDYCREKVFSLTSEFNMAALSCDCNSQGSKSFSCDEYGGQCPCRANVIGRRCDRCAPGHYSFPECFKCHCGDNHLCDERTGQCYCAQHVEGKQCDRCVPYAFGYDPLIGCQLCGCHPNGSEGGQLQCDPNNGQCLCKGNVGGRKCDRCLAGFYGFSHCYECACETKGTTDEICDASNAMCKCKKNVIGDSCDTCRPGTFNLRASNPDGCSECFCFGATDRCRSSYLPVSFDQLILQIGFDEEAWNVTDPDGEITHSDGSVHYKSASENPPKTVYFLAPLVVGQDYTSSYGLKFSFVISSHPDGQAGHMSAAADVRLVGFNMTLDFWASEQPADPQKPFHVDVRLIPENFLNSNGNTITRADLMLVLYDLKELRIKASYYEHCSSATITEILLEVARDDQNSVDTSFTATSVELCQCPAPYTGPSCQQCSPGYYRVSSGQYLGACVPCECNGHSGSCDTETGVCFDCQHDTRGDHCELCRSGFYGDATTGSPYSCLPCACPHPSASNNFALSCQVSETGVLESCTCRPGYASDRCERCDIGYYGEPLRMGGSCEECDCNGNNDLSVEGSCHPLSGDCDLCMNNTDGRHCEYCKQWYYGDAVEAKNCTECACDQCGSAYCDNVSGKCVCQPLVDGDNCDRCVADAWGFSRCQGCQMCNCAPASSSPQCHEETGQCACMPGATGLHCEACEYGYWNYGPFGCKKCDCEADLSLGTVCDVNTGQCHCQEGATGPRCDQCLAEYLRIPTYGCRYLLHSSITNVNTTIGNVSTTALTGARLKRIETDMKSLRESAEHAIGSTTDIGIENLSGDVGAKKTATNAVVIRANRSMDSLDTLCSKLNSIMDRTTKAASDVLDRVEVSHWVVDSLKSLSNALMKGSNELDRQHRINEAQILLDKIRNISQSLDSVSVIEEALSNATQTLNRLDEQRNRTKIQLDKYASSEKKAQQLMQYAVDYGVHLQNVSTIVQSILRRLNDTSLFGVKAVIDGIEKDDQTIAKAIDQVEQLNKATQQYNNDVKTLRKELTNIINELNYTMTIFEEQITERKRIKRNTIDKTAYTNHVHKLETEATRLSGMFGATRLQAEGAVEAANTYKELLKTISVARELAQNASVDAKEAKEFIAGQAIKAKSMNEESGNLLRMASDARKKTVNEIGVKQSKLGEKLNELGEHIDDQKGRIDALKGMFDDREVVEKANQSEKMSTEAKERIDKVTSSVDLIQPELLDFVNKSNDFIGIATTSMDDLGTARSQIIQVANLSAPTVSELEKLQNAARNTSDVIRKCREKLDALKEKISLARDVANRIKLGVHFEKDSSLELPLPKRVTRSAAYTSVELFFRTTLRNSLLLFFGNEQGVAGTRVVPTDDYIAIELVDGHPRLIVDLGVTPLIITSTVDAADGHWRKIFVERFGKTATLKVSAPNSANYDDEKSDTIDGPKSVLNLNQKMSRLFVGGVPRNVNISSDVQNRFFIGDIEDVRILSESMGLWNAKSGGSVNVQGAERRPLTSSMATDELALSFNGDGYVAQNLGAWNPRRETVFSLNFETYSPDGLLLYVGKDRDFMSVELQDGAVKLSFDFGSGVGKLVSTSNRYNDGKSHSMYVHRVERHAKLQVDNDDITEGESPGTMFELSVTDVFYVGGIPANVSARSAAVPLRGCVERVKLENDLIDLSKAIAAKGIQPGCPSRRVRIVSLLSERSSVIMPNASISSDISLTLRFKTNKPTALLISIDSQDQEHIMQVRLDNGFVVVDLDDGEESVRTELGSASDGQWHFVAVHKTPQQIHVDLDDLYTDSADLSANSDKSSTTQSGMIRFGNIPGSDLSFEGCIGDVTYNGKLLDFADSVNKEVELTGCSLLDHIDAAATFAPPLSTTTTKPRSLPLEVVQQVAGQTAAVNEEQPAEIQPESSSVKTHRPRAINECTLLKRPYGEREDSTGTRFGLSQSSRLEFDKPPGSFDKNSVFSVQLRATASNGIIMFTTNDKHTDHLAVYLVNGIVHFAYNSGSGQAILKSNRSILDDEWHSVRAEREGIAGTLYIDDVMEANGQSPVGTDAIDTQPPIYIGGVPSALIPFATIILPGTKSVFGGCLRDFKLNDKKFDVPALEVGTVPCSQYTEDGLYFGREGGYVTLSKDLKVGSSFIVELEVRPRTKTGVLLSIGVLEFLTVQFLNGSIKFTVDNGGGAETISFVPPTENALCDGHWHHIKLYKTKNLMTLTVDGKSKLHIMKKGKKTDTNTKDPLYLGGVPKGIKPRGLDTTDSFIGCVRVINMGKKPRKRKNVDISQIAAFGDVQRNSCPVN